MIERKFTDEEIIKALECCADNTNGTCEGCPFKSMEGGNFCIPTMCKHALNIINRNRSRRTERRKQSEGEWIKATPCSQEYCNKCGLTPKTIFGKLPPFCPNCGAKMRQIDNG